MTMPPPQNLYHAQPNRSRFQSYLLLSSPFNGIKYYGVKIDVVSPDDVVL